MVDKEIFEHPRGSRSQKFRNCTLWSSWQTRLCDTKCAPSKSRFKRARSGEKLRPGVTSEFELAMEEKARGAIPKAHFVDSANIFPCARTCFCIFPATLFLFAGERALCDSRPFLCSQETSITAASYILVSSVWVIRAFGPPRNAVRVIVIGKMICFVERGEVVEVVNRPIWLSRGIETLCHRFGSDRYSSSRRCRTICW